MRLELLHVRRSGRDWGERSVGAGTPGDTMLDTWRAPTHGHLVSSSYVISLDHNRNINLINWPTRHHCVFIIINFWLETVSSFYRNPTPWNDKIVFVGCRLQYCVLFLGIKLIHGGLDNICLHPTVIKLAPSLISSSTFLHDLSHWSITWRYPIKIGPTTM